jgi:mevalonate kinase
LGSAIDLRVRVAIKDLPGSLEIVVGNLGLTIKGFSVDVTTGNVSMQASSQEALIATRYISAVLEEFGVKDICARVESDIPLAAGLGSSAAIVVASLGAINQHFGLGLSRDEIASQAYRIEKRVQDGFGSQMDTALATYGGYRLVSTRVEPIDLPEMEIVVGYTERPHDTRSEVQKVQSIRKRYPDVVDPIFQAIGAISGKAVRLIQDGKLEELGGLMNLNHGLLEAIGVSTRELNELVYAARGAGRALGAKLTGAGGGGCIISLPSPGNSEYLLIAIEQARGKAFCVRTGCQGLRMEE